MRRHLAAVLKSEEPAHKLYSHHYLGIVRFEVSMRVCLVWCMSRHVSRVCIA